MSKDNGERLDLSKLTKQDFPMKAKLSHEQEDMVTKLFKTKRIVVDAIAGSGKTTVLTQAMMALKKKGKINRIYYVLFPVQEGAMGFLPGDVPDKVREYAVPFIQALLEAGVNPQELNLMDMCNPLTYGDYKIVPHTFLRGRTLDNVGAIIDESQNGTVQELRKTFTRFTDDCYIAIAGHNGQIDIKPSQSGFAPYIRYFKQGKELGIYKDIDFAELTIDFRGGFSAFADKITNNFMEEKKNGK